MANTEQKIVPNLWFDKNAEEAGEFYTSLFEDAGVEHAGVEHAGGEDAGVEHAGVGFIAPYPQQTGPADVGSVMFGEFQLAGQWFSMMDSPVEQDFIFTCGVSLEVRCGAVRCGAKIRPRSIGSEKRCRLCLRRSSAGGSPTGTA